MIYIVQKDQSDGWEKYLREMHALRSAIFSDRLGWEVKVRDGLEIDEFDNQNPLYVLSIGDDGQLLGSLRLLPTTGPNMLEDVFPVLLGDHGSVRSPLIWEASRFCVATHRSKEFSRNMLSHVTSELLIGLFEIGKLAGLSAVVGVHDANFKRILQRAGWREEIIGTPTRIGKVKAFAGLFPIDDVELQKLRDNSGIYQSVLNSNVHASRLAA